MNGAPPSQAEASGPGAALLAERRRQNLSLGDVSRQLKLSVRQVEALERDDFAGFQGPVFVHGFLRNYAKLLALDPAPLVLAADRLMAPADPEGQGDGPVRHDPIPVSRKASGWPMATVAAVVVAGIALLAFYPRDAARSPRQPEAESALPIAAVPATSEKSAARKAAQDKPSPRRPQAQADGADRIDEKVPTSSAADEAPSGAASGSRGGSEDAEAASQSADAMPRTTLRMIFDQESWVEIKDRNGNTVFGQLNAAGTRRSASGEPPLTVVVGNAAGVRMFVGNESFDLAPHTRVDVARFTVE